MKYSRRNFLRNTASGVAGTLLASQVHAFPGIITGKQKKAGIALVGLGYYSTDVLAPALQETETAYLVGIVTGSPWKEEKWAKKYGIPKKNIYNYENFDSIAENRDIDIVYVVLPNSMHKEFTIRAANAGKHVICEKPMAVSAAECSAMIESCRKNNVLLSIGYRLHYDPYNQEVMRLGQDQVFGPVRQIDCGAGYYHDPLDHWKLKRSMGGGAMLDMGVYPLQAARYVTGEEPVRVNAQKIQVREAFNEVEEGVTFQLEFPSLAVANLTTGFHAGFNFLYVSAARGRFQLQPFSGYGGIKGRTRGGEMSFPKVNQQAAQMDDMAKSVIDQQPVKVPGEEGLKDLLVIEAIREAMEMQCSVAVKKVN